MDEAPLSDDRVQSHPRKVLADLRSALRELDKLSYFEAGAYLSMSIVSVERQLEKNSSNRGGA